MVSVKVPAKLKRALEERAETEHRTAGAVVVELLEKVAVPSRGEVEQ
jgi:molybdopterin converting factor small subunit